MTKERLLQLLSHYAEESRRTKQIADRLKDLLPIRLEQIHQEYKKQHPSGKAKRLALLDPRYLNFLEELSTLRYFALQARTKWQNLSLLLEVWRFRPGGSGGEAWRGEHPSRNRERY